MEKMSEIEQADTESGTCPATLALNLISRKWSLHILQSLLASEKPIRFGELQRLIANISQRELTKHLREFEDCGIVNREVFPQVPPRVEYELTEVGRSLCGPLSALHNWAEKHGSYIQQSRAKKSAVNQKT